jgi:ankyrin repeat protein
MYLNISWLLKFSNVLILFIHYFLIRAAQNNNLEIVKLLLNVGADIDKQTKSGDTALIIAANNDNNREIIELLLDYGADEFILDDDNESFYYYLNDEDKEYFTQNYPTSVYNAISHNYKKSFTEFVKDHNIKIKK